MDPRLEMTRFHRAYYSILDDFVAKKSKRLIVSVPPQHGKSYGASHLLPAYLLGVDPKLRICIASYSFSLARRFGLGVQRIIESESYQRLFPNTKLKGMEGTSRQDSAQRTTDEFDIVGHSGGLRVVGREGSLTGSRVDVMILDDMYKDAAEANSPLIRENVWQWYSSVVKTRLHNDSRELIVFTRWSEDDLIGRLLQVESKRWRVVNFEALKASPPTKLDPRQLGVALWPRRHSRASLEQRRSLDPVTFEALYQGDPKPREGVLYGEFQTYGSIEEQVVRRAVYIDTADRGRDYLCAIAYSVGRSGTIYVSGVVYSREAMEVTEGLCAELLSSSEAQICYVESNNGGRGFARTLQRLAPRCRVDSFFQSANKVSRILSNATEIMRRVYMPLDWIDRWGEFSRDLLSTKREVEASVTDDAADALTGIIEKEVDRVSKGAVSKVIFTAK